MSCYVDNVEHAFGRMKMCHLWADGLDQLLAMVDKIGVNRRWIQGHPTLSQPRFRKASWCHFDIAKAKKELAIWHGAVLTDRYEPLAFTTRLRMRGIDPNTLLLTDSPSAETIIKCQETIDRIDRIRAMRAVDDVKHAE